MSKENFVNDKNNVDLQIERTLNNTFKMFLSQKCPRFPEFLAKHCDMILQSKENYEEFIDSIIKIFRVISEKDYFMKFYERMLGNRLI